MILERFKIEDDLWAEINEAAKKAGTGPKTFTKELIALALSAKLYDKQPTLMVRGEDLKAVERVFETTVRDGKSLANKIRNLTSVGANGLEISLTADLMEQLKSVAEGYGAPEQSLDERVAYLIREAVESYYTGSVTPY